MLKRFRRLWQRVNVGPEFFDNRMTHILLILDVARYFDDILVGEATKDGLFAKTLFHTGQWNTVWPSISKSVIGLNNQLIS